ncbi:hypothetical protein H0H93_016900, partial [Arthromyces matolae]
TNPRPASAYTQAVSLHPPPVNPRRTLAQPIHPDWAGARSVAEREHVSLKKAKIKKEEMQKQEDRTVLLVVWYADGKEPLRLNHYIESFPKFQLASSASLISDLDLTPRSYVDLWQGEWNTITLDTVFNVEKGQRVLLRLRPNLRTEITDCPGFDEELSTQSKRRPVTGKRAAAILVSPLKKAPRTDTTPSVAHSRHSLPVDDNSSSSPQGTQLVNHNSLVPPTVPISTQRQHGPQSSRGRRSLCPPSYSPSRSRSRSPPITKGRMDTWPLNYYVCDIDDGFKKIQRLRDKNKKLSVADAYKKVFNDAPFVRLTYYKYEKLWSTYDEDIKQRFIRYGRSSSGLTRNFLRVIKKPDLLDDSSPPSSPIAAAPRDVSQSPSPDSANTIYDDNDDDLPSPASLFSLPSLAPSSSTSHSQYTSTSHSKSSASSSSQHMSSDCAQPQLMCEYCDEDFPLNPSVQLLSMRNSLEASDNTWSAPTTDNPGHREATHFTVYIGYCERHQLETKLLPEAEREGWPCTIDFKKLYQRVLDEFETIETVLADPLESPAFQLAHVAALSKGKGKNMGTWDRFTEQSVGYYGEIGYEVIDRALRSMFSAESVDMSMYSPLGWDDIVYEFLIPEVATILIQQDLGGSYEDAVEARNRSRKFGNQIHRTESDEAKVLTDLFNRRKAVEAPTLSIKEEPLEVDIGVPAREDASTRTIEVIDLTLDSD